MELYGFIISASIFALTVLISLLKAFRPYKQGSPFKAFYIFFGGVLITSTAAFIPLYIPVFNGDAASLFTIILSSLHNAIRLFIVDCDMSFVIEQTANLGLILRSAYRIFMNMLMVIAPILTVGAILSFFASISAYFRYAFSFFKDVYIFSDLNQQSLSLAKSLKQHDNSCAIVFMDVFKKEDEESFEIIEGAKEIGAILFKSDITIVNFNFHSKLKKLYFFIIGNDELENMDQVVRLAGKPKGEKDSTGKNTDHIDVDESYRSYGYDYKRGDTRIYLFSTNFSSEQNLSALKPKYIKIRRVNDIQSMIYNLLYKHGNDIFDHAVDSGRKIHNSAYNTQDNEKLISALIVGMGKHGTEMVKSLTWFAQMHPYRLEINAFDIDPNAASLFQSGYPELFDCNPPFIAPTDTKKYHNGDFETPGEAHYKISIFPGIDATLSEFDKKVKELPAVTYVFVGLGSDDLNLKIATKLRILFRRINQHPAIHTIICNPNTYEALENGTTVSGDSYNIKPFGKMSDAYSRECILKSEIEEKALERHMKYVHKCIESGNITGDERKEMLAKEEEAFWKYDYNYRSSIASAIHTEFKVKYKVPGSDKTPDERTEDEKWFYRRMEHQRWNAYVRSEGYVFAPVRDKLAKTHHFLIPFEDLPYDAKIKDDD